MILNFAKENGFKVGTIGLLPVLHIHVNVLLEYLLSLTCCPHDAPV